MENAGKQCAHIGMIYIMTLHFVLTRPVVLLNLAARSIRIDVECNL